MANKVKYGLKNVHYAVATLNDDGSATYANPVPWRGAVNLSLDAEGDVTKFRADNIDYWVGQANNGYSGDFESALIPDEFKKDVLGYFVDGSGMLVEDASAPTVPFALLFQFEGDQNATRHVFYNCTASRPTVAGQTTEETIEPQTETVSLTATSIYIAGMEKDVVKGSAKPGDSVYDGFFESVHQPTNVAPATFTVTFETNGGTAVAAQEVASGGTATEPTAPTKADNVFDGWYSDFGLTQVYDFATPVTSNITIYAKWTEGT